MKRIKYIMGACLLLASLITAGTHGYISPDIWEAITKADETSFKNPTDYWKSGTSDVNVTGTPQIIESGKEMSITITESYEYALDLTSIIDNENYTYYRLYRSENSKKNDNITAYLSGIQTPNAGNNAGLRQYGDGSFLWYRSNEDKDLRKALKYVISKDAEVLGDDELIMEVSTLSDYQCKVDEKEFVMPSEVTQYKITIKDERTLKFPTQYWNSGTSNVEVNISDNGFTQTSEELSLSGKFSKEFKIDPEYNFAYIKLSGDLSFNLDGALKGVAAHDATGNTTPRMYKDGVAVWYRTQAGNNHTSKFTVYNNQDAVAVGPIGTCTVYLSTKQPAITADGGEVVFTPPTEGKEITYSFNAVEPTDELTFIDENNILHEKIDTLYVLPGERIQIAQQTIAAGGIKGYLAWHAEGDKDYAWYKKHLSFDDSNFKYYKNGIAGSASGTGNLPKGLCYIYYHADKNMAKETTETLIWDASNWKVSDIKNPPEEVTIRHKYIIKHAQERIDQLKTAKDEYTKAAQSPSEEYMIGKLNTAGFFEKYDIHTPYYGKENGTSFRLVEVLSNYYLPDIKVDENGKLHSACAWGVRWSVYDENGDPVSFDWYNINGTKKEVGEGQITLCYGKGINGWNDGATSGAVESPNIFFCKGLGKDEAKERQQKYYITAEVGCPNGTDNGNWYPVSLYTIYLEPYADFKTQEELNSATDEYRFRQQSVIEQDYELLDSITFDAPPGDNTPDYAKPEVTTNYRRSQLDKYSSEYASSATYAYDEDKKRATDNRTAYRGEYGIFKTLNVKGISSRDEKYNDYFCDGGQYYVSVHDRMYETSKGEKYGYFMYVDATDIPGVIVKLPLNQKLCSDTRLLVTAWVCNLQSKKPTNNIAADIGFTFKGIKKTSKNDSTEVILNKFYTGAAKWAPQEGGPDINNPVQVQWQQVCFYFNFEEGDENYDEYILEVANNCRHSDGADYAIDDIRVYKMNPQLFVEREEACDEKNLVVRTGYDHILGVYGKTAGSTEETAIDPNLDSWQKQLLHLGLYEDEFNVYYAFTDGYKQGENTNNIHWLFLDYNNNGQRDSYGRIIVSTSSRYYEEWKDDENLEQENLRRKAKAILDYKKVYDNYASLNNPKTPMPSDELTPDQLKEQATTLGITWPDNVSDTLAFATDNQNFLELSKFFFTKIGVAPIQLSWQTAEDKEREVITLTHIKKTVEASGQTQEEGDTEEGEFDHSNDQLEVDKLYHVGLFKDEDFTQTDGIIMDECFPVAPFKISFNGLSVFIDTDTEISSASICSYTTVPLSAKLKFTYLGENDSLCGDQAPMDWYVGTMDDKVYENIKDGTSLVEALIAFHEACGASLKYRGTVENLREMTDFKYHKELLELCDAGLLYLNKNGFDYNVTADRKKLVAIPNKKAIEFDNTDRSYVICTDPKQFEIPMNTETPQAWLGIKDIAYPEGFEQPAIRLGLEDISKDGKMKSLTIPIREVDFSSEDVHSLGFAQEMETDFTDIIFTGNTTDPEWKDKSGKVATLKPISVTKDQTTPRQLVLEFFDFTNEEDGTLSGLQFREGFEYELQIRFHEYDNAGAYLKQPCDGVINFMLKIVPEYVTWTGSTNSRNWNNDANWERSSFTDLYKEGEDPNGTHPESFAPMAFTKVTIMGEGANPILLDTKWSEGDKSSISDLEDMQNLVATDNIEFDLMVNRENSTAERFYANTCDEIYFKPGATLMSQQYLTYDTARVDFEMEKDKWYLLSSPLRAVVAGDMYSPGNKGARQETDAFASITFDPNGTNANDRFAPAYYQRKWDNTAILYFRNEGYNPDPDTHDSSISANWSTEYNNAEEAYTPGAGFSVHVENLPGNGTTSLVRLPKGDTSYDYYSKDETTPEKPNNQKIERGNQYGQLSLGKDEQSITVNLENLTDDNKYFLAGNPFMTYLDMKLFLEQNSLKSTYWFLDENGETVVTRASADGVFSNMEEATAGYMAPMQGFFVYKEEQPVTKAIAIDNLTYTTGMMLADKGGSSSQEETVTKSASFNSSPALYIEAERSGRKSSLSLIQQEKADAGYREEEDVAVLLNVNHPATPIVYSIAGTQATCINVTPEMANIPLGVYSEDESDVTLRFAGLEHFGDSLYLYDALKNEEILIDSRNAEVTVPGTTHGRYFLNVSRSIQVESQIHVYTSMPGQVVVASTAGDLLKSVRVYDLSGKMVSIFDHLSTTVHQFSLPTGFYIVCAESESCTEKSKISVR